MLPRYYLVADTDMPAPANHLGVWHAIHLGSHGTAGTGSNVVVLQTDHAQPPAAWQPLPRLIDAKSALKSHVDHHKLTDIGLAGDETMLEVAQRLGEIHPLMGH